MYKRTKTSAVRLRCCAVLHFYLVEEHFLPRDAMQSAVYAGMRCPSVCLSRSWVASKRIKISSKFFHHLVVPCQTGWRYSDGNPSNGGVECRWNRQKTQFWM